MSRAVTGLQRRSCRLPRRSSRRERHDQISGLAVVQATDRVTEYFSGRASDYQARSTRFPWVWIRSRELTRVGSLLGDIAGLEVLELGAGAGFYTRELTRRGARQVW